MIEGFIRTRFFFHCCRHSPASSISSACRFQYLIPSPLRLTFPSPPSTAMAELAKTRTRRATVVVPAPTHPSLSTTEVTNNDATRYTQTASGTTTGSVAPPSESVTLSLRIRLAMVTAHYQAGLPNGRTIASEEQPAPSLGVSSQEGVGQARSTKRKREERGDAGTLIERDERRGAGTLIAFRFFELLF